MTEVQITTDTPTPPEEGQTAPSTPIISPQATGSRDRASIPTHDESDLEIGVASGSQNFEAACSSNCQPCPSRNVITRLRTVRSNASLKLKRLDPVKMAYLRTSFIFAFAVLITWIPSSINRLYSLTHGGSVSFQLSVASGCVLPLQGVWNALIYFTTSWRIICEEMEGIKSKIVSRSDSNRRATLRVESRLGPVVDSRRDNFERL